MNGYGGKFEINDKKKTHMLEKISIIQKIKTITKHIRSRIEGCEGFIIKNVPGIILESLTILKTEDKMKFE